MTQKTRREIESEQIALAAELGKAGMIAAFETFIKQRPGLCPEDYGTGLENWRIYRNDGNAIAKLRRPALVQLWWATDGVVYDPVAMGQALASAYSGRLSLVKNSKGKITLEYKEGQYWPTEYREAAIAVISSYKNIRYNRLPFVGSNF